VEIRIGSVVESAAGHDKGVLFAVIGFADEKHALIADGKVRRLEKPKKKKLRHLEPLGQLTPDNPTQTNRQLRNTLRAFKGSQGR
jgi:Ribosomal protein L14E/L6E/L27E